ncbi:MAG: fasciclin domain-containing protein [Nostocaceae cyanobacterium]|nr:fasciclin domain-containing protein [Nostocaceae cyanobacterium]
MNAHCLSVLTKKLAVMASVIGVTASVGVPAMAQTTDQPKNDVTGNIVQVVSSNSSLSKLSQAIDASGLKNTLANGNYTLLAPTDEAFSSSFTPGAEEFLLKPENRSLLRQILAYHIAPGEITSSQLATKSSLPTLGGGVSVRRNPERVIINNASLVQPDIPASNGVVHTISRVLIPPRLREQISSLLKS